MTKRYTCSRKAFAELYLALAGCALVSIVGIWSFSGILSGAIQYGFSWWHPFFLAAPVCFVAACVWGGLTLARAAVEVAIYDNDTVCFRSLVGKQEWPAGAIWSVTRWENLPLLVKVSCGTTTIVVIRGTIDNFDFLLSDLKARNPALEIRI
jgi:hypothetical protein